MRFVKRVCAAWHWRPAGDDRQRRRRRTAAERRSGRQAHQSAGQGDEPLSAAARAQSGRLVSLGRRGAGQGQAREEADLSLDRLFELLLVPRDGARVVHGRGDRRQAERELRVHQGRSRGAARHRRNLHAGACTSTCNWSGSKQGGGWPLSMFLTPDAKPLMGGTYFPPRDKDGRMGFLTVLDRVQEAWTADPAEMAEDRRLAGRLRRREPEAAAHAQAASSSMQPLVDARAAGAGRAVRRRLRRLWLRSGQARSKRSFPSRRTCGSCSTTRGATRARRPRRCSSRPWRRFPRVAFAITSAADFIATAPIASGACRISKRCSTTTANWSRSTRRPTS